MTKVPSKFMTNFAVAYIRTLIEEKRLYHFDECAFDCFDRDLKANLISRDECQIMNNLRDSFYAEGVDMCAIAIAELDSPSADDHDAGNASSDDVCNSCWCWDCECDTESTYCDEHNTMNCSIGDCGDPQLNAMKNLYNQVNEENKKEVQKYIDKRKEELKLQRGSNNPCGETELNPESMWLKVPQEEEKPKHKCTCPIREVWAYGCKCGGI